MKTIVSQSEMKDELTRFVDAQANAYALALDEIKSGRKRSHWMWFVFPQVSGLGSSAMAQLYAIRNLDEAKTYLAHPVLGKRLLEISSALMELNGSAHDIFGSPDDLKLRSSMTLFTEAGGSEIFQKILDRFFDGKPDPKTLSILRSIQE